MSIEDSLKIFWLVSYPRSGNTWIRFLLSHLLYGGHSDSFDVIKNITELSRKSDDVETSCSGIKVIKTHLLYNSLQKAHLEKTAGFIYIVRNPIDVMIANLHYHYLRLGVELPVSREEYARRYYSAYLLDGGDVSWANLDYGSWKENLQSWQQDGAQRHPHLIIRYEDMIRSPKAVVNDLLSLLNIDRSPEQIQAAMDFSSLDNMKKMENQEVQTDKDTFFNREVVEGTIGRKEGKGFINKGKMNRKNELAPDIRNQAMQFFKKEMMQFNYE